MERRQRERVGRDRLGRQHLHQADALQGVGQHRAQRLERADHGRRGHQAHHHGHDHRQRGHRRGRARVLRPVDRRAATGVVDVLKTATGKTSAARRASPRAPTAADATPPASWRSASTPTRASRNTLAGDPGYSVRTNVSPANDMELLVQDRVLSTAGTTAGPTTATGANTPWLAATIVFKTARARRRRARPTAQRRHGLAGQRAGDRELDRARRRRQPDHEVHGHALRRRHRADADRRHGQPAGHDRDGHRPGQQHDLHVHGLAPPTPTARARPRSPPTR